LHMAARSGDLALFKLVISSLDKKQLAAVAGVPNGNGDTPLHLAMQHGNPEYAAAILKGCRKEDLPGLVTPKDAMGNTLLHLVCKAHSSRHFINYIVKFLTDNLDKEVLKGLVNDRNLENKTPMHCAASQGNKYASRLFPLCNTNTLTIPDAEGNLVSGCISDGSSLKKGTGLFGLKPSLFKKILKAEADAKAGLPAASLEVLSSVDESPVEGKENDGVEILTGIDHSASLTADPEPDEYGYGFSMSRLSASQGSSISSLISSGKVSSVESLASAEPSLASRCSSFSTFGKGSSSDVTPSGQHGTQEGQQILSMEIENIVSNLDALSGEIDAIVEDMQPITV
ncbi:MAG: ankyrin repeat domain-containing protein, partial [Rickettsia endosymbiont of Ixodes persulcatus]|nr:ankyrin repeat domain-containing protein [Rickettsia endosymbiont of Ixodes persulcatus]